MATALMELYDALKDAGAGEEKARKAAEAVANFETRFSKVESEISTLKWMWGVNTAAVVTVLVRTFFP